MQTEHRIDELIVDLSFNTTRLARHETALLSEWLSEDLLPALDNLFSHYAPGKQILRFETLEFNLGNLTSRNYQQTIREQLLIQFAQLLQTQLLAVIPESKCLTADRLNSDSGQGHLALQQLLRYLATGQLAAHYPSDFTSLESRQNKQSRAEIKSALHGQLLDAVIAQHNIADLLRELPQRDALIQRLLTQFSVIQRMELLRQLAPQHVQWVIALLDLLHFFENNSQAKGVQLLDEQAIRLQQSVWQALLQLGLTQPNANEQVWINDILPRLASTLSLSEIQLRQDLVTLALPVNNTELLNLQVQIAKSLQASNLAEGKVEIPLQIIPAQSDARQNQSSGDEIPTGSSQQTQELWRQLLAAAWIRADAQQLQKFWPQLIAHEQALLLASIQHYLPQAEIRQQLMLRLPLSLQIDIVALLAPWLKNTFNRLQQQAAQLSNYIAVQIEPFPTTATANKKNNDNNQSDPQSAELVARQLWEISLGLILDNKSKNINSEISSHVFLKDLAKRYAELHNLESTALHQIFEQFVFDHKQENILENENFSRQDKQANSTELTGIAHSSAKEAANHNSAPLETTLPTATAGEDKYPLADDNLITISDHQLFDLCLRLKSGSQAWSSLALDVALLKRLISSYIRLGHSATGENCADFVAAINNHAQSSHVPSAFYLAVLQALIADQLIDLELIAQQIPSNAMALADKNNNLSISENTEIAKELNSIKNQQKISQGITAAGTTEINNMAAIAQALLSNRQPSVLLQALEFDKLQWQQLTIAVIQQAPFFDQEARAELTAASQTPINQLVNPAAYYQAIITAIIERQPLDLEAIAITAKGDNTQSAKNSLYKDTAEPAEKNMIYDRNQEMAQPATKTGMQNPARTTTVDVGQIFTQDSAKVASESLVETRLHEENAGVEQKQESVQQATELKFETSMRNSAEETMDIAAQLKTESASEARLHKENAGAEQKQEAVQQTTELETEKSMRSSALEKIPPTAQHTTELVAEHYLQQEIAGIEQKQETVQQALESDTKNSTRHSAQKVAQTSKQDITQSAPAIITSASSIVDIAKALLSEQQPSVLLQGLEFDKQQWQQLTIAVIQQAPFFDQEARAELTAASQTPINQLVNPAAYYQAIITAIIERQPLDLEAIAITAKGDNTQSAKNSLYKDTAEPAEKNMIYDRNQEMAQPATKTGMQNPARTTTVDVGQIFTQDSAKVASESLVETRLHEENAGVEQKQESVQQATELKFETSMRNSAEETMDIAAQLKTESASEARLHKENAGAEQKQEAVQQTTELETEKSMRSSALEKIPPTAQHTTELVAEHYLQQEIAGIEQKQETVQQALESDTKNSTRHSAQKVAQTSKQDITQSAPAPTTSVKSIVDIAQVLLSEREPLSLLQGLRFDQAQWQQLTVALMQQEPLIHLSSNTDLIKAIQLHALKTVRVSAYYQLLINSILQRQPIDLEACVAAAVDGAGLVNKNTNNENLLDTDNRQSEQPILHQAMDYLPISEKDRSIDNTGLLLPALLGAELPLNREQLLALQQYINQLLNRPTQAIFAEWRALLAIAQHARVLINSIPAHLLHRIIMRLQPERYPWLDAVVKIVMEALALLVADTNSLLIKQTKWEFIFNYVFSAAVINTSQTPAQALDLAIELCGRLANATGIEDEQRLVNLTQRRLALLRPPATLKPAMRLQEINTNPTTNNDETTPQWESGLHINNAGQVLAGAFLPRLFSMLNLIQDGKFIHPAAADRAVHLVQFMVTGQSSTPEYDLILNKILCGISSSIPISAGIEITEQERTLIEQMLTSMIQHWKVLGSTSISGLRETFFQRQGWLVLEEDCWRLKVKEQTFDLLLDRLPWSISLIKHGWMDKPLRVSWRDFS